MVLKIRFVFLICICSQLSWAQNTFSILEQNPFSVKHQQIQLKNFPVKVIYPQGLDSVAQYTANQLERNLASIGLGMESKLHKWNVVLQNQGMVSNGFVSLSAPRAEYFTTPTQDPSLIGTSDWISLLAVHESRHMYQNEIARTGRKKWLHNLYGNNLQAAYTFLMIPNWVWEGDAIETETRVVGVGRSVIPQFQMPLRAYLDYYKKPSYAKITGRSYRELVPNHYVIGQHLVQSLQNKYGQDVIGKIWRNTLDKPLPFSFSRSVKKVTGKSIDSYAKESLKSEQLVRIKGKKASGFTNYLYPTPINDSVVVALKSGFDVNMQLVMISGSQEKRLCYIGPYFDNSMLSSSPQFVIWSEYLYHPRWGQKNHTIFQLYDLHLNKRMPWKSLGKATNPSISPDSKYIGTIVYQLSGASSLQVFDRVSGKLVAQLAALPGEQFVHPRLQAHGDFVYISKKDKSKSIKIWNWQSNGKETVEIGTLNAAHPYLKNNEIIFNLPVNGVDQVVGIDRNTKEKKIYTNEKYGAYNGSLLGDKIIFNRYTAIGYQVALADTGSKGVYSLEVSPLSNTKDSSNSYSSKTYSKWNIVNPYAWGLFGNSQVNLIDLGIVSKDVLNNLQTSVGYQWNTNERTSNTYAQISYQGFFPVLDASFETGNRFTKLNIPNNLNQITLVSDTWNQTKYSLGFRIPFNLTHSVFQESLELGSKFDLLQISGYDLKFKNISQAPNGTFSSINYHVNYAKLFTRTYRDLQPKWGIQLAGKFSSTPFKQSLRSEIWSIQTRLFFPGMLKHHGFSIRSSYQQESRGNYRFTSQVNFPRGYTYTSYDKMFSYSLDYRFPVAMPDLNLGRVLYLKRLNMNLFMDGGQGRSITRQSKMISDDYQSFGVDLLFQLHLFRFSQQFELGVRGVYLPQSKDIAWFPLVLDIAL
jgi:hypothetical protein